MVTKISKIFCKRWKDRSFKQNLKKDEEDEEDDEPQSQKATQDELEELYKGR